MTAKSLRKQADELHSRVLRIVGATTTDRRLFDSHIAPLMDAEFHLKAAARALDCVDGLDIAIEQPSLKIVIQR